MAATTANALSGTSLLDRKLKSAPSKKGIFAFLMALAAGVVYIVFHVAHDLDAASITSYAPYVLLALALLIALGFEFVNGFHDTANAVATVIYTHSLEPNIAVVWSGICNLAGVLFSSGTVAFAVITLLPVELILQVSSGAGFAMVFALLIAAILWNLGTWWFGLPASSSHTMVGSIIGVGIANQLLMPQTGTSGVDWEQAMKVLKALLISPVIGFVFAGLLILLAKQVAKFPELYEAPKDSTPPPFPIRALMVLTCTGVSFFHGSNDGQKGMGLIMLILIGTVPTAYALNHAVSPAQMQDFIASSEQRRAHSRSPCRSERHSRPRCAFYGHRLHPHQAVAARHRSRVARTGRRPGPRSRCSTRNSRPFHRRIRPTSAMTCMWPAKRSA